MAEQGTAEVVPRAKKKSHYAKPNPAVLKQLEESPDAPPLSVPIPFLEGKLSNVKLYYQHVPDGFTDWTTNSAVTAAFPPQKGFGQSFVPQALLQDAITAQDKLVVISWWRFLPREQHKPILDALKQIYCTPKVDNRKLPPDFYEKMREREEARSNGLTIKKQPLPDLPPDPTGNDYYVHPRDKDGKRIPKPKPKRIPKPKPVPKPKPKPKRVPKPKPKRIPKPKTKKKDASDKKRKRSPSVMNEEGKDDDELPRKRQKKAVATTRRKRKRKTPPTKNSPRHPPTPDPLIDYVLTNLQGGDENQVRETLLRLARIFREQSALCLQQAERLDRMAVEQEENNDQEVFENVSSDSYPTRVQRQNVLCFAEKSTDIMIECQEKLDSIESGLVPWGQKFTESAPKVKQRNPFNLYSSETYDAQASRLGTKDSNLIMKEIGKDWKALSQEEKDVYRKRLNEMNNEIPKKVKEKKTALAPNSKAL